MLFLKKYMYNKLFKFKRRRGFVSVIIPVYKDHEGASDTLNSLSKQSLKREQYEIIVANDGGDKQTRRACEKFDVKVIDIFPNGGSYNARNKALQISKGEYIALLDSDDEYLAGKLEKQILEMKKSGASFSLCNYFFYFDSKRETKKTYVKYGTKSNKSFFIRIPDLILTKVPGGASLIVFKKEMFSKLKFDSSIPAFNDLDFLLRLKKDKILFITEPLVMLEKSANRERISINYSKKIRGGLIILEKMRKGKYNLSLEEKKLLEKIIIFNLGIFYLLINNFKEGRKFLNRGIFLSKSFPEKLKYGLIYITSFLPPLFKTLTFVGKFFWKFGLLKI
jgi:glycosyltransferase involved in cell wall biosynthesis